MRFVDAFGPIAVAQVTTALQRPGSPVLIHDLTFIPDGRGGQIQAIVLADCHITVTMYHQPDQGLLEDSCLHDADVAEGVTIHRAAAADLSDAYSLVVVANREEFHHLPFL